MKPGAGRTARFADQVRFVHQVAHGPASGLDPPPDGTSARLNQAVEFAIRGLVERSRVAPLTRRHWARSPGLRRWS
jgi:hypothetical protein